MDFVGLHEHLKDVDSVYHCAAMVSFSKKNREKLLSTNIRGTSNMVDASIACGVKKFCFISSIAALGSEENNHLIDEDSFRDTNKKVSDYSESKYRSELEVWRGNAEGLNTIILNPGVILGPGLPDKGSLLFFNVAKKGMPFYTDATTGYVDVRDISRAALELMAKGTYGERFAVVSENIGNKQLFSMIAAEFGKKGPSIRAGKGLLCIAAFISGVYSQVTGKTPQFTKDTARSAKNPQQYSSKKIIDELNFKFTPISQTISETCDFLKRI
jgi:nucleoside-diphosphate-sugar epimerase